MKQFSSFIGALVFVLGAVFLFNYLTLSKPVQDRLDTDERNKDFNISVHYQYYLNPSSIVIDLKKVPGDQTKLDVFRVLLNTAVALKDKDFNQVYLSYHKTNKFLLKGDYFATLGKEYEEQNPMYTMRTFPENVLKLDGTSAYAHVEGGWLGVMGQQMDDFKDMFNKWYIDDISKDE